MTNEMGAGYGTARQSAHKPGGKSRALRDGDVLHVLMALAMRVGVLSRVGRTQAEGRHRHLDRTPGRRQRNETDESSLSSESNHG